MSVPPHRVKISASWTVQRARPVSVTLTLGRCCLTIPTARVSYTLCTSTVETFYNTINTLRPRQNGRHFADDTFKCIFLKENVRISIEISLKFVPRSPIDNIPALFQVMAWRRWGDKPLSEAMMVSLLTHICVARPQLVNFCWSTHKRHSIARPKGRGMGCLLWVQRATYCVDLYWAL